MKTLYIVRHAKSSWKDTELSDFERPLNQRGKTDAPVMGLRLAEMGILPDLMYASPAKRAWSTAIKIAKELGYEKGKIEADRRLYHAEDDTILSLMTALNDKNDKVMIFGHNPGLTHFANLMMEDEKNYIDNIPTCGVVAFYFSINTWKELTKGKGKLLFFDYPKNKPGE